MADIIYLDPLLQKPQNNLLDIGGFGDFDYSSASPETNLGILDNVLPALPIFSLGLLSQAPNVIDNNINKASVWTPEGVIHSPDPPEEIDLEEWKRRNIHSTPIYEPNIDDYTTGGEIPIFNLPQHTGHPVEDFNLPTHTGHPPEIIEIPNILTIDNESKIDGGLLETPDFYSRVTKAIENSKMNKGDISQWKGMIKNAGVNQDELDWLGLDEEFMDTKSVTKDELLDYAIDNDLADNVAITILGEEPFSKEMKRRSQLEYLMNEIMKTPIPDRTAEQIDTLNKFKEEHYNLSKEIRNVNWRRVEYPNKELRTDGDYTDYREMIFQLPHANDKEYVKAEKEFIEYRNALDEKYDPIFQTNINEGGTDDQLGTEKELEKYQELQNKYLDLRKEQEGKVFKGGHYKSDKNVFAHARFNTRIIDGKKTLYIEELQSDWVHKGKKIGFGTDELNEVPDLPFKKNWHDVVFKKLIKYASENGFDAIAMTGGNIQKERYDLSQYLDNVTIKKSERGDEKILIESYTKNNEDMIHQHHINPKELEQYVGKELAEKINNDLPKLDKMKNNTIEGLKYSGLDLKIGGEGLAQMYDKVFSKSLKKIGNKFNTNVETKQIFDLGKELQNDIQLAKENDIDNFEDWANEKGISTDDLNSIEGSEDEIKLWLEYLNLEDQAIKNYYYMELSPSLKDKAIESGFPIAKLNVPQSPLLV
tara:strand:+ start:270 stop:2381 length:2112 start_codon:yes stop_codon:yes gene_type:complete